MTDAQELADLEELRVLMESYDALRPYLWREPDRTLASNLAYKLADAVPSMLAELERRRASPAAIVEALEDEWNAYGLAHLSTPAADQRDAAFHVGVRRGLTKAIQIVKEKSK